MALVVLSAGAEADTPTRTVKLRTAAGMAVLTALVVLALGFALGYGMNRGASGEVSLAGVTPDDAQGRLLIDRFGELSGRVLQLEAEAVELAARIGMIRDFEARMGAAEPAQKPARAARRPDAQAAGGPMLRPIENFRPAERPADSASRSAPPVEGPWGQQLERIEHDIGRLSGSLARLDELATAHSLALMSFPGRSPVAGVEVGSSFGNRLDPFNRRLAFHSGIDYAAPKGTPILASAGGKVVFAAFRREYGNTVEIDHGGGLVTRYAHASKILVKVGEVVMPGQEIAKVGSTGRSTGPHLHFEILKDGRTTDPERYIARLGHLE